VRLTLVRMADTLKRINAPPPPEESRLLRVSVLVAVLAAVAGVVGAGVGGVALGWIALVAVPSGHALSYLGRHRPGYLRKSLLAAGATVAFARFLIVAASSVVGAAELRVPLGELFVWIQVLHSFDLASRRDLLFTLLSSLSLMLVAGVLSTSPVFGALLGVWAVASLVSLILSARSQQAELPRLFPGQARAGGTNPPAAFQAVVAMTLVAVWTAVTFTFLPAPGDATPQGLATRIDQALPVPQQGSLINPGLGAGQSNGSAYFGFSSSLDLAARGRPDSTPVMRVRARNPDFWRGQSFDVWDGRRWTISPAIADAVALAGQSSGGRGTTAFEVPPTPEERPLQYLGRPLVQTFYLEQPGPNLIYGAYRADQIFLPFDRAYALGDGTVRSGVRMGPGTVYSVISRRPPVTAAILRGEETLNGPAQELARIPVSAAFVDRYLQLPDQVPPRVRQLAASVTLGTTNRYDQVKALEAWMGSNLTYTLDIPRLPVGRDAVEQFLFVDRQGYCEQIATSLVVMLRTLGVPARLAVGFVPGERNPFSGTYQVRAKDAHAWAEVFFPGIGWQAFDPTASVPLAGDAVLASAGVSVVGYVAERLPGPPAWAAVIGALIVGLVAGAAVLARWVAGSGGRSNREWGLRCMSRIQAVGARRSRPRRPGETMREYSDALMEAALVTDQLSAVVRRLEAEVFSGHGMQLSERASIEAALAAALRRPHVGSHLP